MSNNALTSHMHRVLDDYEVGRLTTTQVERAFDDHMEALEGINLSIIHQAQHLTYRLVTAFDCDDMDEFIGGEEIPQVLADMRRFLLLLPGGAVA